MFHSFSSFFLTCFKVSDLVVALESGKSELSSSISSDRYQKSQTAPSTSKNTLRKRRRVGLSRSRILKSKKNSQFSTPSKISSQTLDLSSQQTSSANKKRKTVVSKKTNPEFKAPSKKKFSCSLTGW